LQAPACFGLSACTAKPAKGFGMAAYQIDMTEDAKADLSCYSASERKLIVSEIRD
jgi:hypothetical protein